MAIKKSKRVGAGPKRKTAKKQVDSLKSKSPNICAICLEPLKTDIRKTHCNHRFHRKCLTQVCDKDMKCPLCRSDIEEDCDNLETGKKLLPHQIKEILEDSGSSGQDNNRDAKTRILRKLRFPKDVDTGKIISFSQALQKSTNRDKVMKKITNT